MSTIACFSSSFCDGLETREREREVRTDRQIESEREREREGVELIQETCEQTLKAIMFKYFYFIQNQYFYKNYKNCFPP